MDKKSDVDILIEQCIQDVNGEYLEEGFVDNIKAGLNGAKEWLKADARNSFKFGKKNDIKNDRRWSARKGKVASYAKSIANTMQDFKKQGGTLGKGMKVDDVISRLNQVAQGKYPREKSQAPQQNQTIQSQQPQATEQPQTNKPASSTVQKQPVQQTTSPVAASTNSSISSNSDAQNKMLNSIGSNIPQETTTSEPKPTEQKPAKSKGPGLAQKAGKALTSGAKKLGDAVKSGYKGLKDKMAAAKDKKKVQPDNPEIIEPEIIENPVDTKKQSTTSTAVKPAKQPLSPSGRPMRISKGRVVDVEPANKPFTFPSSAEKAQNDNPHLALPAPAPKKKLSNAEKAKRAISKAQANVKKAKANAPKLNIPGAGKPVKRRNIITAKQRKDIDKATKEMEDFHRGLGDTGAEWEETIHESFYGSNTSSQLKMLNSIR